MTRALTARLPVRPAADDDFEIRLGKVVNIWSIKVEMLDFTPVEGFTNCLRPFQERNWK